MTSQRRQGTGAGRIGRLLGLCGLGLGVLAMTACSGTVQERLGIERRSPDEFQVVRRAPLVIPPSYNLPEPGTPSPAQQRQSSSRDAQRTLFEGFATVPELEPSAGELALLEAVPGTAEPGIREIILTENTEITQLDESRFLFILDFQRRNMEDASLLDTPLDAQAEAERLSAEGVSTTVVTRRTGSTVVQ